MSDAPNTYYFPPSPAICNSASINSGLLDMCVANNGLGGTAVWNTANRAYLSPFYLDTAFKIKAFQFQVATQSGNVDVGIYDINGNRIVSKGSTAVGTAGQQVIDLTTSVTGTASPVLDRGIYYMAMVCDNTTASFARQGNVQTGFLRTCGCAMMSTAFPLPNPITLAAITVPYMPIMTIKGAVVT